LANAGETNTFDKLSPCQTFSEIASGSRPLLHPTFYSIIWSMGNDRKSSEKG
jgi:hypothetical protein